VSKYVRNVSKAIVQEYGEVVSWPRGDGLEEVKRGFMELGFPNCCGAIDCTQIEVDLPPGAEPSSYYGASKHTILKAQCIADSRLRFLDVRCFLPGRSHDSSIWQNSSFYDKLESGDVLSGHAQEVDGVAVPEYLLGDAAYGASRHLIAPYPGGDGLPKVKANFNFLMSCNRNY